MTGGEGKAFNYFRIVSFYFAFNPLSNAEEPLSAGAKGRVVKQGFPYALRLSPVKEPRRPCTSRRRASIPWLLELTAFHNRNIMKPFKIDRKLIFSCLTVSRPLLP